MAAEKFLRDRLKETGAEQLGLAQFITPAMKKLTVKSLLDALKSNYQTDGKLSPQAESTFRAAQQAFGGIRAVAFDATHVNQYIKEKLDEGKRNATINRVTQLVGRAFELAREEKRISKTVEPFIRHLSETDNVRQGFIDAEQFAKVRANLPADLQDFAAFAFATAWRKGEIAGLDWSNIQNDDTMIRLRPEQAKNGHGRSVPITGELTPIIERRRAARTIQVDGTTQLTNLVFHRDGEPVMEFRKAWATACKKAGVPNLLFHDLRRSAVTAMVQAKIPLLVARQISGHKTDSMFARYNICVEATLEDAMNATEEWHKKVIAQKQAKQEQEKVRAINKK